MMIQNVMPTGPYGSVTARETLAGRTAECATLEQLLRTVRGGQSAVVVVRGDRGIGKTTLLDYASQRAAGYRIIRAHGLESEMDFPYAGLQLLCAPLFAGLGAVPSAPRQALEEAVGMAAAASESDRLLVGLGLLALLKDAAATQPLLCVIDDAQWLDRPSAQVLTFVIRRLEAQPIEFLLAEREPRRSELGGLPELRLGGLSDADARGLLSAMCPGRIDPSVVDRIIAETRGNPLILQELLRGISTAELAGGFHVAAADQLSEQFGTQLLNRVGDLPRNTRRLLLAAACEPTGDPAVLWRAATHLGIPTEAAGPLESERLLSLGGPRVLFRDPLLRSAIYAAAAKQERRETHQALAVVTDPESDRDRRAWHRGLAAEGPDEETAREMECCATRAADRGGLAASAAFLEKAAVLTPDPGLRAERAVIAAAAKSGAGAFDAAARLLVIAEVGPPDESRRGRLELRRARIAFALRRDNNAPEALLNVASRLAVPEPELAREAHLDALGAAIFAGRLSRVHGVPELAQAARAHAPTQPQPRRIDYLLDGLVARFTDGYAAGIRPLRQALEAFRESGAGDEVIRWLWLAARAAADLWDDEAWRALTMTGVRLGREAGALTILPYLLADHAVLDLQYGDFAAASVLADEADAIATVVGCSPLAEASLLLAAWRGREARATELVEKARQDARDRGEGVTLSIASLADALLYNGLGRYDEAREAARDVCELDELQLRGWGLAEFIEAAARSGQTEAATQSLTQLTERTRLSGSDWALGIEARSRALLTSGPAAEHLYLEAIERLRRSPMKLHLARAQLVYGEWLRRKGRRLDARVPLRAAYDALSGAGAEAFAERAHRELHATGERARRRSVETHRQLTPQETRIAVLARDGLTNPEIGARLFVSPRTVEYHLHKVFAKLGIRSRTELHLVLVEPAGDAAATPAETALREPQPTTKVSECA